MMFTQCRGCGELFSISVDELVTSAAKVRCSACGTVFLALDTLADYRPKQDADLILHDYDNPPPLLTHETKESVVVKAEPKVSAPITSEAPKISAKITEDDSLPNLDFVNSIQKKKPSKAWGLLSVVLFGVAIWQATEGIKSGSIKMPEHDLTEKVCATIHCYKPQGEESLDKIALVSRSIRQHPGRDNALKISIGMINGGQETQKFPALQIKMSNLQGEVVAMRRFLPSEYIDQDSIRRGMLSNTLIPVTLDLKSPGQSAVTFEVSFSPTYDAS